MQIRNDVAQARAATRDHHALHGAPARLRPEIGEGSVDFRHQAAQHAPNHLTTAAIALGVAFRDESVAGVALVGMALVLAGAWLTSRAEAPAVVNPDA